jgi:hypothetical protein
VSRFRSVRNAVLIPLLCAGGLLVFVWLASQIEQHIFRQRAERLLAEVQAFELRKTTWDQVQSQFRHWGPASEIDTELPCNQHTCSMVITLSEAVYTFFSKSTVFIRIDDYLRWRFKQSYMEGPFVRAADFLLRTYIRLGGRPAKLSAIFGMRDGLLWSKDFTVTIAAYSPDLFGGVNIYSLLAGASTVPRFRGSPANSVDPQVTLHPDYVIGGPDGCEVCIAGWVNFTPYAEPAEIRRLTQFDLSCLTRFHQCLTQADLMPIAWKQYQVELPRVQELWPSPLPCSPSLLEWLGRDSIRIAAGEIMGSVHTENARPNEYRDDHIPVRVLAQLKGVADWKVGEIRLIPTTATSPQQEAALRKGMRLIFFGAWGGRYAQIEIDLSRGCPIVPLNDTNLALVRLGIAQDNWYQ